MNNNWDINGGVLIIGSLLWQDHLNNTNTDGIRKNWRDKHLAKQKILVRLPIRYGRYSGDGIYTMVFSGYCDTYEKKGTGYVIPFAKNPIRDLQQLYDEMKEMSHAEGMNGKFSKDWGRMGILFNAQKIDKNVRERIIDELIKKVEKKPSDFWKYYKFGREKPCITPKHVLNIKWPDALDPREIIYSIISIS